MAFGSSLLLVGRIRVPSVIVRYEVVRHQTVTDLWGSSARCGNVLDFALEAVESVKAAAQRTRRVGEVSEPPCAYCVHREFQAFHDFSTATCHCRPGAFRVVVSVVRDIVSATTGKLARRCCRRAGESWSVRCHAARLIQ